MSETAAFARSAQQAFEENGSWDMSALESGLREALMRDGCHILQTLLNQPSALGEYEPEGILHDQRKRTVHSLLGTFELTRGYYRNEKGNSCPMDEVLGLVGGYSPGLAKLMCRAAGMDGSYDEAEQTLNLYAGVIVPASQRRSIVQTMGPELKNWSETRIETRCEQVPKLYVSYDGTGVPMRKEETQGRKGKQPDGSSTSREVKLGCIFTSTATDSEGHPLRDPQSTTYLASFDPAEDFGLCMLKEARLRGMGKAGKAVVSGDGAHWIWKQAEINFPGPSRSWITTMPENIWASWPRPSSRSKKSAAKSSGNGSIFSMKGRARRLRISPRKRKHAAENGEV